jgi:hypothetical protein
MLQPVREALEATADQPIEVKAAVASEVAKAVVPTPLPQDVGFLWRTLVMGLVAAVLISLGGIIFTVADANADTSPDVIVTVFTSALTGLIGLFVQSPTGQTGK